jgi:hypothetical protein
METLGHSQISLTPDTYSHFLPGLQAEAAKRMEALGNGGQNGCQPPTGGDAPPQGVSESPGFLVSLNSASWNQIDSWLRGLEALRHAA